MVLQSNIRFSFLLVLVWVGVSSSFLQFVYASCPLAADCEYVDNGSCGNACCFMTFVVPGTPSSKVKDALQEGLSSLDGYSMKPMDNSADVHGFSSFGFAAPLPGSEPERYTRIDYIGQASHETDGKFMQLLIDKEKNITDAPPGKRYNDTMNFLLFTATEKYANALTGTPDATVLKMTSTSDIGGAYGDSGQNYNNIATLVKYLNQKSSLALGLGDKVDKKAVLEIGAERIGCPIEKKVAKNAVIALDEVVNASDQNNRPMSFLVVASCGSVFILLMTFFLFSFWRSSTTDNVAKSAVVDTTSEDGVEYVEIL
ncbi:unnamed protein product [Amoebophrya sp. A25]|nr:unnamed protein product [Amoebophrya sp. A25]|eukprot:GSA25T00023812001.1